MQFEDHLSPVYSEAVRFARGLAGSASGGDDLLQDALIRAWQGFPHLRRPESFRSWLLRIISNTHRSWSRRRRLKRWLSLDFAAAIPARCDLPYEEKVLVRRALGKLPREQRESLVLFEVLGMSVAEIAQLLELSPSAVKSRLARGRSRLRNHYARLSGQEMHHVATTLRSDRPRTA